MTLWGVPERVYVQNMEQLHVSSECNLRPQNIQKYTSRGRSSIQACPVHAARRQMKVL